MSVKVAINGFGRIGRLVLRAGFNKNDVEFVAVNDLTDPKTLAHLLKYDSVHGIMPHDVKHTENSIIIDGKEIKAYAMKERIRPNKAPRFTVITIAIHAMVMQA